MGVQVSCSCGRSLNLADGLRGKKVRCPECAAVLTVPTVDGPSGSKRHPPKSSAPAPRSAGQESASARPAQQSPRPAKRRSKPAPKPVSDEYDDSSDWLDDSSAASWDEPQLPTRSASPSKSKKQQKSATKSSEIPRLVRFLIILGVSFGMFVILVMGRKMLQSTGSPTAGPGTSSIGTAAIPDVASATVSQNVFPPRPTFQPSLPAGVQLASTRLTGTGPGEQTQMNIYLPAGQHAEKSLGCVLVAPAGTNLLIGNALDGADYHNETLPYADAGFLTVQYSLDGPVADMESASDPEMAAAYLKFKAAGAGTLNTKFVIEFIKARFPEVDASRIYTAGHSSAGTVSLLAAEYHPDVAACIAYAPCSDTEAFHKEISSVPGIDQMLPGIAEFDRQFSPVGNVQKLKCPLFVFQARDDSVVQASETQRFVTMAKQHNQQVEYVEVDFGDHYDSMIGEGIPKAVQWLKRIDSARSQPKK